MDRISSSPKPRVVTAGDLAPGDIPLVFEGEGDGGAEEGLGVAYQSLQIVGQLPRIEELSHVGAPEIELS